MKKIILIMMCIIVGLYACKKGESQTYDSVMAKVQLKLKSSAGADLLDPGHESYINGENTDLYYLVSDKKVKYFNGDQDYPKGFNIHKDAVSSEFVLEVFVNQDVADGEISTNILEYQGYAADTIKVMIRKTERSVFYEKLWLNGEEISLTENKQPRVIIKAPMD